MVRVFFDKRFEKIIRKIRDNYYKNYIKKLINKIKYNNEIGKPMKNKRKGTRELYVSPYRLAYAYFPFEDKIIFLDFYHKDEQ